MRRRTESSPLETTRNPRFMLGVTAQHYGRERSAMAYYRSEIRRTGYWKAHFNLAGLLSRPPRRRLREALQHYQAAIACRPPRLDAADAWANIGLLLHTLDRSREALLALSRARRLAANNAKVALDIAMVFFEDNKPARGKEWLRRWAKRGEHSAESDKLAAYLMIQYGVDVHRGVVLLKGLIEAHRQDPVLRADLAVAYAKLDDRRSAQRVARQARRLVASKDQSTQTQRIVRRALRKAGLT